MSVPELRFKQDDGQDFPEWKSVALGNVISIMSGISPSNYSLTASGVYPFLKVEDLNNCSKYQIESREYSQSTKNLVPKESIIFPKRGAAILNNKVRINLSQVLMDSNLMAITPIDNELNFEFLYYKILNDKLYKIADTSTIPQINNKHILPYVVSLPKIAEQTKIANFLTAVDEKITQLTQKHDLLTQYKKGVMQQIFSQELRFKDDDGEDFPEWEETTLESCATFFRGGSLSKSDIDANGKFSCVHYGELFTTYNEIITTVKSKTNITNTFNSEFGDILMPSSDVTPAGLAKASCILKAGVVLGGDINIIRVKNTIAPSFLSYLLNFEKNKIIQLVSGTTVKHIYIKDIKSIELSIPTAIAEQNKIANLLTAIDDKITSTQAQLDAVKQYKQGLLQQMFV